MKIIFYIVLVLLVFSCDLPKYKYDRIKRVKLTDINGCYRLNYPHGQVEVLKIYEDSVYQQLFYNNKDSMKVGLSLYVNKGDIIRKNDKLDFENWLVFSEAHDLDTILNEPLSCYYIGVSVYSVNSDTIINFFDQNEYQFTKTMCGCKCKPDGHSNYNKVNF